MQEVFANCINLKEIGSTVFEIWAKLEGKKNATASFTSGFSGRKKEIQTCFYKKVIGWANVHGLVEMQRTVI